MGKHYTIALPLYAICTIFTDPHPHAEEMIKKNNLFALTNCPNLNPTNQTHAMGLAK